MCRVGVRENDSMKEKSDLTKDTPQEKIKKNTDFNLHFAPHTRGGWVGLGRATSTQVHPCQ